MNASIQINKILKLFCCAFRFSSLRNSAWEIFSSNKSNFKFYKNCALHTKAYMQISVDIAANLFFEVKIKK